MSITVYTCYRHHVRLTLPQNSSIAYPLVNIIEWYLIAVCTLIYTSMEILQSICTVCVVILE